MQAVLSLCGDWEALCARLGVEFDARDWPAGHVMPNRFFGDRGDMISGASNALCDGVSVQVTNAPALASRRKPIVESGFLSTHVALREDAPGYEPPKNPFKRRAKKYHKDGCLTLDELAAHYLRIVIAHNRKQVLGYQQSPNETLANLSCAPRDIWVRKVVERMGSVARMPADLLRRKLMPKAPMSVKDDGIHFNGLIYKNADLKEWFSRASLRGEFDVTGSYSPNLVDKVVVYDPFDDRKQHVCVLTTTSEDFAGYSHAETKFVTAARAEKAIAAKRSNEGHDVALRQDMNALSGPAAAEMRKAARGMTPGMRKSAGDAARAEEAMQRRGAVHDVEGGQLPYGPAGAGAEAIAIAAAAAAAGTATTAVVSAVTSAVGPATVPPLSTPATPSAASATELAPSPVGDTDPDLIAQLTQLMNDPR